MTVNPSNEHHLILECRNGNEKAFDELYSRYRLPLFSYLHKLLPGRPHLVEDVFQHVWIKAIRNFSHYQDQQKFFAWLCRIAYNLAMDHFRQNKDGQTVELTEILPADDEDSSDSFQRKELQEAIGRAIGHLNQEQQEIVRLRLDGMSFKEIAEHKNIKLNTALGRMRYAVLRLRELLSDFTQEVQP